MDYKDMAKAILVCGSEPTTKKCEKECPYFKGGNTKKCIPPMTKDVSTAITDLLARAEAAEARVRELEKLLSAVQNMENFHPDGTGFFVFTKKEADEITGKLAAAEARAEKAERAVAELMGISPQELITTCFGHQLDRVMELVKADREGLCSISPKLICKDEVSEFTQEQYRLFMGKFSKGEQDG